MDEILSDLAAQSDGPIPAHGEVWSCGHRNYGDQKRPASVYHECPACGGYYCDNCNYDRHVCGGCGFEGNHGSIHEHWAEGDCTL